MQDVEAVRVLFLDWELEVDYARAGGGDFELRGGQSSSKLIQGVVCEYCNDTKVYLEEWGD